MYILLCTKIFGQDRFGLYALTATAHTHTHTKKVAFIARRLNKLMQNIYVLCHASLAKICKLWLVSLNPTKKTLEKKIGADGGRVHLTRKCYFKNFYNPIRFLLYSFTEKFDSILDFMYFWNSFFPSDELGHSFGLKFLKRTFEIKWCNLELGYWKRLWKRELI